MKSVEKKIDNRFSIHIALDNAGFYVIFRFNLLDGKQKKSIYHENYTKHAETSIAIKSHLNRSENDFIKKSKKVIEHIKAMEGTFDKLDISSII
ncbi:hypothetical protein [Bacillus infantis]|uniref:hypothetical protein n=1 Tax=Bacillus infantis TaxID=324767 RepID=UPI00209D808F|nr:hypothetical protein [Bacillus infantis]MCP1159321.1 hypothetical protein [Bacillus infantis]